MSRLTHFFSELRRRRVITASAAYLVVAWLLIEISSIVFPALLMPDWTHRLVVILAMIAFPVVVVLAWIFDISPSGIETTEARPIETNTSKDALAKATAERLPPRADTAIASICVLPFEVLSSDPEDQYIAQGVCAEVASALSKVPGVRVVARAGKAMTSTQLREAGAQHDVQYVLTGSLRRQGQKIRIIAQLADAQTDTQLWSETYNRVVDDVMEVEEAIAESIVGAFGGENLRAQIAGANEGETAIQTAWSLVHKARSHILNYSAEALLQAEGFAREALKLDPAYAAAHAALADVLCERVSNGLIDDPGPALEEAIDASNTALGRKPNDPFVLKLAGSVLRMAGQQREAIELLRRAVALSRYDLGAWGYLGSALAATDDAAQLTEANEILDRILEMAPQHPGAGFWWHHKALAATCAADYDAAVISARRALEVQPQLAWAWYLLANALAARGDLTEAGQCQTRAAAANPNLTLEKFTEGVQRTSATARAAERRLAGLIALNSSASGR